MRVVKIGGSLEQSGDLLVCLNRIVHHYPYRLVIVPGGGRFADQVRSAQRRWHFDDSVAHEMAILAMQQMALLLKALQPQLHLASSVAAVRRELDAGHIGLWSPEVETLNAAGIAASWDVTSDSLAAWLAAELDAEELILVKSVTVPAVWDVGTLSAQGIVDKAFVRFTRNASYNIIFMNPDSV